MSYPFNLVGCVGLYKTYVAVVLVCGYLIAVIGAVKVGRRIYFLAERIGIQCKIDEISALFYDLYRVQVGMYMLYFEIIYMYILAVGYCNIRGVARNQNNGTVSLNGKIFSTVKKQSRFLQVGRFIFGVFFIACRVCYKKLP